MIIVADFETTTDKDDCRVWGFSYYNIALDCSVWGKDIDDFMTNHLFNLPDKSTIYFHNLKFDGEFIFYWLFQNGFSHSQERNLYNNEFKTLISWLGQFYSMEIRYKNKTYIIYDSLKIIPMKVSQMSKAFGIKQLKGEIDYNKYRPIGYTPDDNEISYMINDVEIVGKSLLYFFKQGLTKMTQASNAMGDYKSIIGKNIFEYNFPVLDCDDFLRKSYKGGFTYVSPLFQNKIIDGGVVLDVNSLYPSVMYNCLLPYGEPKHFKGKPKLEGLYKLYVVNFTCQFEVKKDHIPSLQIKNNPIFGDREYLHDSQGQDVNLTMTNVDFELFQEQYDIYNLEYNEGYYFLATDSLFKEYIDKWTAVKIKATEDGNAGLRTIAKLMLNALYGKFGTNPMVKSKYPIFEDGLVKYKTDEGEMKDPVYVALASFVTSYARQITISSAQKNYNRFIYADTDSLHLVGDEIPDLKVHDTKLGYWAIEGYFTKGKFIRAKSYIEEQKENKAFDDIDIEKRVGLYSDIKTRELKRLHVTCAGMPDACHKYITFDNFKSGTKVNGKKVAKRVKGGVVIEDSQFTIKI